MRAIGIHSDAEYVITLSAHIARFEVRQRNRRPLIIVTCGQRATRQQPHD